MGFFLAVLLAAQAQWGAVARPVANMYSAATEDSDVVSQAIYGARVDYLERREGWIKVRTFDDYTGWMPAASIRESRDGEAPYASTGRVAQVWSLFAHLYREPDVTRHQPVLTVPFETKLEIVAEPEAGGRWLQVRLVDDRPAWVQRGDLEFSLDTISIEEVIELSKQFLGLPYTWGGTSSFGFDCSGFTQMLCRRRGVFMPRDAGPQARWEGMSVINRGELEPGDLVYFGRSVEKITHTGFYIGGGEFIHSTTNTRPVLQISRLDDEPWTTLLVACRRPK